MDDDAYLASHILRYISPAVEQDFPDILRMLTSLSKMENWIRSNVAKYQYALVKIEWTDLLEERIGRNFKIILTKSEIRDGVSSPITVKGFVVNSEWSMDRLDITYDNEALAFFVQCKFDFALALPFLEGTDSKIRYVDDFSYHLRHQIAKVPVALVRCWMRGRLFDTLSGIEKPTKADGQYIEYRSGNYPSCLVNIIQSLCSAAFDDFRKVGFMSPDVFELISYSPRQSGAGDAPMLSSSTPIIEQRQKLEKAKESPSTTSTQNPKPHQTTEIQAIAIKLPKLHAERLEKAIPFQGEVFSLSEWGKLWEIGKTAAREMLLNFEREGLVTLTSHAKGTSLYLTEKGSAVLEAYRVLRSKVR